MFGPADDLKGGVKALGMSDPMAQVGSAMGKVGAGIQAGAAKGVGTVRGAISGMTGGLFGGGASRKPAPRGDINLPPVSRVARSLGGKKTAGAYGKGRGFSKGR